MELGSFKQMVAHFGLCNKMTLSEVHKAHELVPSWLGLQYLNINDFMLKTKHSPKVIEFV